MTALRANDLFDRPDLIDTEVTVDMYEAMFDSKQTTSATRSQDCTASLPCLPASSERMGSW
ncbi:MAG TPA: hypothetical protein VGM90_28980 [Kofleriaceae bacterium]